MTATTSPIPFTFLFTRTSRRSAAALRTGLGLLALAACDPTDDLGAAELLADDDFAIAVDVAEPTPAPQHAPSEQTLRAVAGDPEQSGLLCVLCVLGGSQSVCGADNVTYDNKCWATCSGTTVVHTGACTCGDGYAGPGEACDDGNTSDNDGCRADCTPASCGDGVVWTGHEGCDDGNTSNTDACLSTCVLPSCGDGFVHAGVETCDDGNTGDGDACTSACLPATCGDGHVWAGHEACDDGDASNNNGCLNTCETASCGDGYLQFGAEACDDGDASDTNACTNACVVATCGDGLVWQGVETCDDGDQDDTDECLSDCAPAVCGDGHVLAGQEACDDGDADNTDACTTACQLAQCGDGYLQAGEACDDGNASNADDCSDACVIATCGDGLLWEGVEQCDDGDADSTDACTAGCTLAACGDGYLQAGEACDDGDLANDDGCTASCTIPVCGDGIVHIGVEDCDDANAIDTDGCTNACAAATCGDGIVRADAEACDDADSDEADGCLSDCSLAASCLQILAVDPDAADGNYSLDVDLDGPIPAFTAFCDMTTDGGGWTEITLAHACADVLGGTMVAVEAAPIAGIDGSCRPFTRDGAGSHTYHYTFEFPPTYTEFYLHDYRIRANGTDINNIAEIGPAFAQSDWNLANKIVDTSALGDVSFGSAAASGPVTSYGATLPGVFSCFDCQGPWPGGDDIYAVDGPSDAFRIGWGEVGPQAEGFYPWWSGTIRVR